MGILAGIDLLGKFLAGKDTSGGSELDGVGGRFINFLNRYFGASANDAEILYQLRNSLLHSFGLYSETRDRRGNVRRVFKFVLTQGASSLLQSDGSDVYVIDVKILRNMFNNAITTYHSELNDTSRADYAGLQASFGAMIRKHGWIRI